MEKKDYIYRDLHNYGSVSQTLTEKGYNFSFEVIESKVIEANKTVANKLEIPIATKVFYYKRIRIVEGVPKTVEDAYIVYAKVKGIETGEYLQQSMYNAYEAVYGIEIGKSIEEFKIVNATDEEAEFLKIKNDSEVLQIEGVTYSKEDIPVECFQVIAVPDFFRFRG